VSLMYWMSLVASMLLWREDAEQTEHPPVTQSVVTQV
jgi:hypothetical protein